MAKISLSVDEIQKMCYSLEVWKTKLHSLCSKINAQVSRMNEWKDPQYDLFKTAIEATYNQANLYIEQLQLLKVVLQKYAENQRDARSEFLSNIDSSH